MSTANHADNVSRIIESITQEIAHSLKESPENVDPNLPFSDMGADSLILLEALHEINSRYHVSLSVLEIYEKVDTIAKVARYIHDNGHVPHAAPGRGAHSSDDDAPLEHVALARVSLANETRQQSLESIVRHQLELMDRQLALLARKENAGASPKSAKPLPLRHPSGAANAAPPKSARPAVALAPAPAAAPVKADPDRFSAFGVNLGKDERGEDADKVRHISQLTARLNEKTPQSKSQAQSYRQVLSDNRVPAGFRPLLKEMVYPILADQADGAHVVDIDGNRYLDFTMGFGVHMFGHSPDFVVNAIKRQLDRGMPIGPQSPIAGKVAELVCELTGHARVTFCNSGTEATMTAVRLARAKTGKSKVVIFKNSYHGTFDGFLARTSAASAASRPASLGTGESMVHDTVVLEYCEQSALDYIAKNHAEIAAVLTEPVQSRAPSLQPSEFLRQLRRVTQENDIALIFDEVITGFRCAPGGAQEYFGVRADLCTYGKVLGGGMPIGVVAGSAAYMDGIDGGFWQYDDGSFPAVPTIFFAGTFSKHPLAMAASLAVLEHIKSAGSTLYRTLNDRTARFCARLNDVFETEGVDIRAECFSSLFRFASRRNLDLFYYQVLDAGFFIWEGRNCFVSTEHTEEDLNLFVSAVQGICKELVSSGLLPVRQAAKDKAPAGERETGKMADAQQRFYRLAGAKPDGGVACNLCFALRFDSSEKVDVERLARAVTTVATRQEALWYRVDSDTGAQERTEPSFGVDRVRVEQRATEPGLVDRLLEDQQKTPLDPEGGRNIRACIYTFQDETALLSVCVHHLVCDGWGLAVLFERIAASYGQDSATAGDDVSYARWIDHEARYKQGERYAGDKRFWHEIVESIDAYQKQHVHGPVQHRNAIGARKGGRARLSVDERVTSLLRAQAKADGVTPFTSLLCGFQIFLNRVYRDRLPIIGVPFANRTTSELKRIVGSCVNLLPLLPAHGPDVTFESTLAHTKQAMNGMFKHANFPYHEMCTFYQALTASPQSAPVEITFNVEPVVHLPRFGASQPALVAAVNSHIEFDLMFNIFLLESETRIELDYDTDLFAEHTVYGWLNLFSKIVENYATRADPARKVNPLPATELA